MDSSRSSRGNVAMTLGEEQHHEVDMHGVDMHPLMHGAEQQDNTDPMDVDSGGRLAEHLEEHQHLLDLEHEAQRAGEAEYAAAAAKGLADGQHEDHTGTAPFKKNSVPRMKAKKRGDKKPLLKSWLCIMANGQTSVLQADKYKLTAQLGIQMRDLRLLDPQMTNTYPSAILCRDKAIVVNLEHIKVIITMDRVLVVNYEDESNAKFVEDLKQRIAHPAMALSKSFPSQGDLQRMAGATGGPTPFNKASVGPGTGISAMALSVQLPFELRVLEVCLDELASEFDAQTTELEASAYPALDTLAAKVTSPHLERVRRLKNRLVRLTTRVETVREVLEKFLDDDEDMHDLNLTANHTDMEHRHSIAHMSDRHLSHHFHPHRHPSLQPTHTQGHAQGQNGEAGGPPSLEELPGGAQGLGPGDVTVGGAVLNGTPGVDEGGSFKRRSGNQVNFPGDYTRARLSTRSVPSSVSTDSSVLESEVAEVEMLLEAYFMHFDNTYNRLTTLNEYIKDTEDLVNIKLDQHRNQLITTDLILTAFTASMAIITTVAGIFGMNLWSGLEDADGVFNQVTIITCIGSLCLFVAFVLWAWRFGLLVFN